MHYSIEPKDRIFVKNYVRIYTEKRLSNRKKLLMIYHWYNNVIMDYKNKIFLINLGQKIGLN